MSKRALIVGIDDYEHFDRLRGCVEDAKAIRDLLQANDDGTLNYECHLLAASGPQITRGVLRAKWIELFDSFDGDILFYFSGHGVLTRVGGILVTQDGYASDPGLSIDELLILADQSKAKSILLILDCCFSRYLGGPLSIWSEMISLGRTHLRPGLTILSAARPGQEAREFEGQGIFTKLVLESLRGGAADVRGRVSAASIYAYVEQALGSWDQRPLYRSDADHLPPVRLCRPAVSDSILREVSSIFSRPDSTFRLDPSFELTHPTADPKRVEIFNKFKVLRNARLLTTEDENDLYFVALESKTVRLTPLGQFYWLLACDRRF